MPCAAHALGQTAHQIGDRGDGLCRGFAVGPQAFAHGFDQRRADHNAVGAGRDRTRLLGGAHAEADADRELGVPLDAGDAAVTLSRSGAAVPVTPVIET